MATCCVAQSTQPYPQIHADEEDIASTVYSHQSTTWTKTAQKYSISIRLKTPWLTCTLATRARTPPVYPSNDINMHNPLVFPSLEISDSLPAFHGAWFPIRTRSNPAGRCFLFRRGIFLRRL